MSVIFSEEKIQYCWPIRWPLWVRWFASQNLEDCQTKPYFIIQYAFWSSSSAESGYRRLSWKYCIERLLQVIISKRKCFDLQINKPKGVIVLNFLFGKNDQQQHCHSTNPIYFKGQIHDFYIPTSSCRWLWPRWPDGEIHEIGGTFKLDPFSALKISSTLEAVTSYVYSLLRESVWTWKVVGMASLRWITGWS